MIARPRSHPWVFLAVFFLVSVLRCSSTSESRGLLTVSNRTSLTVVVFAHAQGALIDPIPVLEAGTFEDHIIVPSTSLVFDSVSGYVPGEDITLFIYVPNLIESAVFARSQVVTARDLARGSPIVIDGVPQPRVH